MKFDPRTKLLTITALTTLSVLAPSLAYLAAGLVVTLAFDALFGVNLWRTLRRLWFFFFAVALLAVIQGLAAGLAFFLRMSIIIFASAIAATSDAREMTDALIKLKFPYEIGFMVSAVLRFFPLLRDELSNRVKAIAVRGVDVKRLGLFKKLRAYAFVIAPAVVGCAIRSGHLADAMTARAFRAYSSRTMLRQLRLRARDCIVVFVVVGYIAAFITLFSTMGSLALIEGILPKL